MPDLEAIASEYRTAYQQLKRTEKQMDEMEAALKRDHDLAAKRYEMARGAFIALALGEDDEFLAREE